VLLRYIIRFGLIAEQVPKFSQDFCRSSGMAISPRDDNHLSMVYLLCYVDESNPLLNPYYTDMLKSVTLILYESEHFHVVKSLRESYH